MLKTSLLSIAGLALALFSGISLAQADKQQSYSCHLKDIPEQVSCGQLSVIESSQQENSADKDLALNTINIHYSVLPAIKASFPDEAVLVIAGGPGQSAVENAAYFNRLLTGVRQQRDILIIDQRGTGASNQLQCESPQGSDPLQFLNTSSDLLDEVKHCQALLQTDLNNYTSLSALDDFEAIRKHLGYKKLHLYGVSYGTRMVQLYMRHHPDVVATATMDGVVPMSQNVLAVADSVDRATQLLFEQCEQQAECDREYPQLKRDFADLNASLGQTLVKAVRHPVSAEGSTLRLNRSKFLGLFRLALYSPQTRALLPYAIHQLSLGNAQAILGLMSLTLEGNDMAMGMHSAVVCAEDWPRLTEQERRDIGSSLIGADLIEGLDQACPVWGLRPSAPAFAEDIRSDIPSLLLSGQFDPATPPAWGQKVAQHLTNARHIIAPYATHGVASQTCAKQLVEELIGGVGPKDLDASCIDAGVERQFFINANGSLSDQVVVLKEGSGHD